MRLPASRGRHEGETRHAISIGQAARAAGSDFYFNSLRFAPANGVWALVVLATLFAAVIWPPATLLLVLSAVPIAGIHRMAALLARGEPTSLSDFTEGMRRFGTPAIGIALAAALAAVVLGTNVAIGFSSDNPIGWFLGASALYGLVALAMFLVAAWPIVVDPRRATVALRRRLQLAGLVLIGRPGGSFSLRR